MNDQDMEVIKKIIQDKLGWSSFPFVLKLSTLTEPEQKKYRIDIESTEEMMFQNRIHFFYTEVLSRESLAKCIVEDMVADNSGYDTYYHLSRVNKNVPYDESIRHQVYFKVDVMYDPTIDANRKVVTISGRETGELLDTQYVTRKSTGKYWHASNRISNPFRNLLGIEKAPPVSDIEYQMDEDATRVEISSDGVVTTPFPYKCTTSASAIQRMQVCKVDEKENIVEIWSLYGKNSCSYERSQIKISEKGVVGRKILDSESPKWLRQLLTWGDIYPMPYHNEEQKQFFNRALDNMDHDKFMPKYTSDNLFKTWDDVILVNVPNLGWMQVPNMRAMGTLNLPSDIKAEIILLSNF